MSVKLELPVKLLSPPWCDSSFVVRAWCCAWCVVLCLCVCLVRVCVCALFPCCAGMIVSLLCPWHVIVVLGVCVLGLLVALVHA